MMIDWLNDFISQAKAVFEILGLEFDCLMLPPASDAQIEKCEAELEVKLSESQRRFYRTTAGMTIKYSAVSHFETGHFVRLQCQLVVTSLFDLVGVRVEPMKNTNMYADRVEDKWRDLIIICDYEDGNYIVLDPEIKSASGEFNVLQADHEASPSYWRQHMVIAQDFEEWLRRCFESIILSKNDPEYWNARPLIPEGAQHSAWLTFEEYMAVF